MIVKLAAKKSLNEIVQPEGKVVPPDRLVAADVLKCLAIFWGVFIHSSTATGWDNIVQNHL